MLISDLKSIDQSIKVMVVADGNSTRCTQQCRRAATQEPRRGTSECIASTCVPQVELPVTVKIRTGESERKVNADYVVSLLEAAGAAAVTVHGRTMEQRWVLLSAGVTVAITLHLWSMKLHVLSLAVWVLKSAYCYHWKAWYWHHACR